MTVEWFFLNPLGQWPSNALRHKGWMLRVPRLSWTPSYHCFVWRNWLSLEITLCKSQSMQQRSVRRDVKDPQPVEVERIFGNILHNQRAVYSLQETRPTLASGWRVHHETQRSNIITSQCPSSKIAKGGTKIWHKTTLLCVFNTSSMKARSGGAGGESDSKGNFKARMEAAIKILLQCSNYEVHEMHRKWPHAAKIHYFKARHFGSKGLLSLPDLINMGELPKGCWVCLV